MRILFDQGTPVPLRRELVGHDISTAFEMGWASLSNGALLAAAEAKFQVLVTTDRRMRFQQNFSERRLAVLVLPTTSWRMIRTHSAEILAALEKVVAGELTELKFGDA